MFTCARVTREATPATVQRATQRTTQTATQRTTQHTTPLPTALAILQGSLFSVHILTTLVERVRD
jgi:hypothetical protein